MQRRQLLRSGVAALSLLGGLSSARAQATGNRLLILLELRGGNDALNTVVPVHDGRYFDLRPRLALREDSLVAFDRSLAVHGSLAALQPFWDAKEMAVIESVGYARPNLSHFRSIEIWDTASDSEQFLQTGWLTRAARAPVFARYAADGVVIGAADLGPLAGGARAVSLIDPERFARLARLAHDGSWEARGARRHILQVERDIVRAATHLRPGVHWQTRFPPGAFGTAVQHAAAIASTRRVPVIRVTIAGFDTHQNQVAVQARLLATLAQGLATLKEALREVGAWDDTLVLTYSEFGRRPRENASGGTDHGTASVMFAFGPAVRGGRFGAAPDLARLDDSGNLGFAVDFRSVYATVLEQWFGLDSEPVLGRRFETLPLLKL